MASAIKFSKGDILLISDEMFEIARAQVHVLHLYRCSDNGRADKSATTGIPRHIFLTMLREDAPGWGFVTRARR